MKTVLTLDLGTSYFKSALVDADGRLCALDRTPAPITRTAGGLCEMSPDQFRETVTQAVRRLADTAPGARVYREMGRVYLKGLDDRSSAARMFEQSLAHDPDQPVLVRWLEKEDAPGR